MSLILVITNDGTGPDEASNYDWRVQINQRVIAAGCVTNHNRNQSWEALVQEVVDASLHHPRSEARKEDK